MADVLHGNASANQLNATANRTQLYGLAGNDTLTSDGKSDVLLIGGSGDDSLIMSGGNGTLSGGAGSDTFELNYSASQTLSAVIEDVDPASDKIVVNFDGTSTPTLNSVASGSDVVLSDSDGQLNVTLKGVRENDYFDGTLSDAAWEVLKLTNDERENQGLSPLTMSDGLTAGASVRVNEIFNNGSGSSYISHTRPNGSEWYTALTKNYSASGENLDAGGNLSLPSAAMAAWIGSASHYANIVNPSYQKLGVGYIYEDSSDYEHYWVQLFGSTLTTPETVSTSNLLTTPVEVNNVSKVIQLADGGDTYSNTVDGATILGGTGNDYIYNSGDSVTVDGGAGNDSIDNDGYATIHGDAGNDQIQNSSYNAIINGGDGGDTITNTGRGASINGGADNDSIQNSHPIWNAIILGGEGDDSISDGGRYSTIYGGAGDDYIYSYYGETTIHGDSGNDSINVQYSSNVLIKYASGDGNDTVNGFDSDDTLQIGGGTGTYSTQVSGSDVIISVGTGSILLTGAASLGSSLNIAGTDNTDTTPANPLLITLTEGDDTYSNGVASATILALGGNDSIANDAANVSISGAGGNDFIRNWYPNNVTIDSGLGNDYIINTTGKSVTINTGDGNDYVSNNEGDSITIDTGAGDDSVHNGYGNESNNVIINTGDGNDYVDNRNSSNVTINAGTGNDSINLSSYAANNLIQYTSGDGNDTINGFDNNDTLQIGGGMGTYSTQVSGDDIIVNVGTGSILLQGAASLGSSLNIAGTESTGGGSSTTPANPLLITLTEGDDTYNNTVEGATIAALGGNDSIDNRAANVSISGAAGNDTIFNWSGDDSTVYGGTGDDSIFNNANSVIIDGGAGNDSLWNSQYEWSAVASATMRGGAGNDAIWNYSDSVTVDGGAGNDSLWSTNNFVSLSGGAGSDSIYNDGGDNDTINGGAGNDYIRLITSLASAQNNVIQYAAGDGNDTIQGFRADSTLQIGSGTGTYATQVSGSDVIVTVGDGSILLTGAASLSTVNISGGSSTTPADPLRVTLTNGDDTYNNSLAGATIAALGGNDTVENSGARVSISGGADNDSIKNSGVRSTLLGDTGDDRIENSGILSTIFGGRGNDEISLSSDARNSYIQYEPGDGNDTIWGNDTNTTLRIVSDNASSVNTGDDVVYYIGDGSIRLVGARIRPPHVVLGASGTSGGSSGGSGGGSGGGSSSGSGGSGGSSGSGGTSGSSGSSGNGNDKSSIIGTSGGRRIRNMTSTANQTVSGVPRQSVDYTAEAQQIINAIEYPNNTSRAVTSTGALTVPNVDFSSMQSTANLRIYAGGNMVVSDYQSGEKIIFAEVYTGSFYDGEGNYCVGSSTGALVIQNSVDKVVDLRDVAGNDFVKAYAATTAGVIDGRGLGGFEVINGSAGADAIFAGDGGSQMWGGFDVAADTLIGGGGTDIFVVSKYQGSDLILNASSVDVVHLIDASLSDIVATEENNGAIAIAFNTGNVIGVQSSELLSATVMLADGSAYRYNHANKSWQSA